MELERDFKFRWNLFERKTFMKRSIFKTCFQFVFYIFSFSISTDMKMHFSHTSLILLFIEIIVINSGFIAFTNIFSHGEII